MVYEYLNKSTLFPRVHSDPSQSFYVSSEYILSWLTCNIMQQTASVFDNSCNPFWIYTLQLLLKAMVVITQCTPFNPFSPQISRQMFFGILLIRLSHATEDYRKWIDSGRRVSHPKILLQILAMLNNDGKTHSLIERARILGLCPLSTWL